MTTLRDYNLGQKPTCNACGCELDPESDCHHDGYEGSPYAHNGRGSYGMGSHHFVFNSLCEHCRDGRTEPLRRILECNHQLEWLECGHTQRTPHNLWGAIRPGDSRRCGKCYLAAQQDFDPFMFMQGKDQMTLAEKFQRAAWTKRDEVYSNDNH